MKQVMQSAVVLEVPRQLLHPRPANDNDPPDPPPAASQHQWRPAPLAAVIAALGTHTFVHAAQAA